MPTLKPKLRPVIVEGHRQQLARRGRSGGVSGVQSGPCGSSRIRPGRLGRLRAVEQFGCRDRWASMGSAAFHNMGTFEEPLALPRPRDRRSPTHQLPGSQPARLCLGKARVGRTRGALPLLVPSGRGRCGFETLASRIEQIVGGLPAPLRKPRPRSEYGTKSIPSSRSAGRSRLRGLASTVSTRSAAR
jgi:hypothetical protein